MPTKQKDLNIEISNVEKEGGGVGGTDPPHTSSNGDTIKRHSVAALQNSTTSQPIPVPHQSQEADQNTRELIQNFVDSGAPFATASQIVRDAMPKELRLNLLKRDLNIESNNHNHIKTIMIRERFRRGFAGASNNAKGAVKLKCIYEAVTELYKRTVQNSPFVIADELGSFYEPTPTQLNPKYFTLTPKDSSACPAFDALMEAIEKPSSPLVQRSDLFMQFNLEAVPKTPSIPTFSLFINPPSPFFCLQSAKLAMEVKLEELRLEKDVKVLGVQPVSTFRGSAKRFEIVITLGEDATPPPPSLLHSAVIYAGSETKDAGKPIILFSKFLPTCATCYTMGNNQHATDCTIFLRKQMQHRASEKASNRQPGGGGQGDNITQRPRTHAQTHNGWTLVTRTQNTRTRSSHSSGHSSSGASSSSSSNSNSSSSNSNSSGDNRRQATTAPSSSDLWFDLNMLGDRGG